MWRVVLTFVGLTACRSVQVVSDGGVVVTVPPGGRCEVARDFPVGEAVGGEVVVFQGEQVAWIGCNSMKAPRLGAVVIDQMNSDLPLESRLLGTLSGDGEAKPSGPPITGPTTLSGVPGNEHRLTYDLDGERVRVLRYVQRGDTLYFAYVMGGAKVMAESESENAAWFDAVRFDDLKP